MAALGGHEAIFFLKSEAFRRLKLFQAAAKAYGKSIVATDVSFDNVRLVVPLRTSKLAGGVELTWSNLCGLEGFHTKVRQTFMDTWQYEGESAASS